MSEQEIKREHQLLDRPFPNPKLPPRNTSAFVDKDLPCSSPSCPNFCSPRCGFCETHCNKFHNGIHYRKTLKADIPEGVKNFLDLKKGSTLEWIMSGKDEVIVRKKADSEVEALIKKYSEITDTDIELVANQANVSLELAKKAIIDNNNDLAKAILSLTTTD